MPRPKSRPQKGRGKGNQKGSRNTGRKRQQGQAGKNPIRQPGRGRGR